MGKVIAYSSSLKRDQFFPATNQTVRESFWYICKTRRDLFLSVHETVMNKFMKSPCWVNSLLMGLRHYLVYANKKY